MATGRGARRLSQTDRDPGQLLTLLARLWAGRKETLALGWGLWETPAEPRPQARWSHGLFCEGAPAAWPGRSPRSGYGLGGLPEGRPGPPPCTALYPAGLRGWACGACAPGVPPSHQHLEPACASRWRDARCGGRAPPEGLASRSSAGPGDSEVAGGARQRRKCGQHASITWGIGRRARGGWGASRETSPLPPEDAAPCSPERHLHPQRALWLDTQRCY